MPYLSIQTNKSLDKSTQDALLQKASKLVSELLNKPETYVMVAITDSRPMMFSSTDENCAYLELKSIALPENSCQDFSHALCSLICDEIAIEKSRIYIEFSNAQRHLWGWNSTTF